MHLSASTFLALICHKFGVNLALKYRQLMQKQHFIIVLFGTNSETLASKYQKSPISTLLMQIRYRFNAHFNCEVLCSLKQ